MRVTRIPKYVCEDAAECGVAEAPRPEGLIEGNRYDASVAAEIITAKYGYHLPIYRQQDYFAGSGWTPGRSTLLNILAASAACLRQFALYLRAEVIAAGVLGTDAFLVAGNFIGKILADCYSGYQRIALRSDARIERAACNAHARRKIFDARASDPLLAGRFLAMYQELYDVETRGKTLSCAEREALRAAEARPVWQRLRAVLDGEATSRVLPKDKFAEALGYLRNHWDALQLYLSDGRLPIDNNDVEQLMKRVAIGRKNWLFVGSVAAGERAADFLTLVSSAVRNDLDVWAYLKDVLDHLLAGDTGYAALRPDVWRQAHPEAIREYRAVERRYRADRKQLRRAERRRLRPQPSG